MGKEVVMMGNGKKLKTSLRGALIIRPQAFGVAAAVAILLILILALPASAQEIQFTGTVTAKNSMAGVQWWDVRVEEIILDPLPPCDILKVEMVISPPFGYIESTIDIGTQVEVYGKYMSECKVSLNDESYYIKKVRSQAPTLTPIGLITLVSLLSAIAAVAIVRKRR